MNRRGSDCDMDNEMYQYFFATEFVDMFPRTNGDILLQSTLVWIGSRKLTSIRTYRVTRNVWRCWKKWKNKITNRSSAAEYLTYVDSVGDQQDSIEMHYADENIWLTQKMMAALYDVDVWTINYHVKKIFSDSELQEESVVRKFRITADDGKSYSTNHYSLEMIIAVKVK